MTNLVQLAKDTADLAVMKIKTEHFGYSVNASEIASVILAALKSVAEQKDAEAAALRRALELAHKCITGHHNASFKIDAGGFCSVCHFHDGTEPYHDAIHAALATGAGTALLRELESLRAAKSHMESCRHLIGARDDETLHDAISALRERVKKASELMAQMLNLASHQIASERLGGNVVKEEYWKGEHAAVTAILAALEGQ